MGGGSLWPHARRDRIYGGGSAERYLWLAMQLQRDPSIDRYDPVSEHTKSSVFQLGIDQVPFGIRSRSSEELQELTVECFWVRIDTEHELRADHAPVC
jgi:hypothetical protein